MLVPKKSVGNESRTNFICLESETNAVRTLHPVLLLPGHEKMSVNSTFSAEDNVTFSQQVDSKPVSRLFRDILKLLRAQVAEANVAHIDYGSAFRDIFARL